MNHLQRHQKPQGGRQGSARTRRPPQPTHEPAPAREAAPQGGDLWFTPLGQHRLFQSKRKPQLCQGCHVQCGVAAQDPHGPKNDFRSPGGPALGPSTRPPPATRVSPADGMLFGKLLLNSSFPVTLRSSHQVQNRTQL